MAKQTINIGTSVNKGDGDPLRTAFTKINSNFTELYSALGLDVAPLNLGAFEFTGSTINTTDSSSITIDQATTINSDLTVGGDILPSIANGGDLGSLTNPWKSLYVSTSTIYLGNTALSLDPNTNELKINNIPVSQTIDVSDLIDTQGLLGGGNANTGDITFDGVKIIGAGTASGDGAGYSTLELVPDNSLYNNYQYLVIDPTAPSHIHIRAGGPQDQSTAELFLGGEKTHVMVRDNGGVRMQTQTLQETGFFTFNTTLGFVSATWQSDGNGGYQIFIIDVTPEMYNAISNLDSNSFIQLYDGTNYYTVTSTGMTPAVGAVVFGVVQAPNLGNPINIVEINITNFTLRTNYAEVSGPDFNVNVYDDVRITGDDVVSIRNRSTVDPITIITDWNDSERTWSFGSNGDLSLPQDGGIVFDRNNTTIRVGMGFHIASGEGISLDAIDQTAILTLSGAGNGPVNQTYNKTTNTLYTGNNNSSVTVENLGGTWYVLIDGDSKYTSNDLLGWALSTGPGPVPAGALSNGYKSWGFALDGNLTLPVGGDILDSTGQSVLGGGTWDGTTISDDLIPDADVTYDLGSPSFRFRDIYLSTNTIYLGSNGLGVDASGQLVISESVLGGEGIGDIASVQWTTASELEIRTTDTSPFIAKFDSLKKGDTFELLTGGNGAFPADTVVTLTGPATKTLDGSGDYYDFVIPVGTAANTNVYVYNFNLTKSPLTEISQLTGMIESNVEVPGDWTVTVGTSTYTFSYDPMLGSNLEIPGGIQGGSQTGFRSAEGYGIGIDTFNTPYSVDVGNLSGGNFIRFENGIGLADVIARSYGNLTLQINGDLGPAWQFNTNGTTTFPDSTVQETAWAGGRVVAVPTHSTGAVGDLQGDLAFNSTHLYYCTADYNQLGHQVTGSDYLGRASLNTNAFQLTKTADTIQITVGDIISDSDGGATSTVVTVSSDANYTYVGTGGLAYAGVFPFTFTSTDYVSGGNIWKRVAWSADTW